MGFKIVRIFSDDEGHTHFGEVEIPLINAGDIGFLSEKWKAKEVIFREVKSDYDFNFHPAPSRQFIILLDGEIEIETSLGVKKRFRGGDVLLVEDIIGKGHKTKNISENVRRSIFITLPDN